MEDDWRSGKQPVMDSEDVWVGYTFFREIPLRECGRGAGPDRPWKIFDF